MIKKIPILFVLLFPILLSAQTYSIQKTNFSHKDFHEFSPVFYRDGLVFTTNRKKGLFSYSTPENRGLFNLYLADTTGALGKRRVKYFSKVLNTNMNDGPATFTPGYDTIYYSRNRLVEGKVGDLSSQWNKLGIFSAVLRDEEWGNIREFRFNSEWYNVTSPWLSPSGKRLYFASDKPGGYGGSDLYYSEWRNGNWDNPVNLGPLINSEGNESFPYINPAGELFFSSDGHPGAGGRDIFFSRYENNAWRKPVPLDPPINSEFDDFGFIADTLMNSGYFSSDRDGSIDIFHFTTGFPQLFYKNYQKENNYCYTFKDMGSIVIDTTLLELVWHFGDGKTAKGTMVNHCYPGPGEYDLHLDVVEKRTGKLFFVKLKYLLNIIELEQAYIHSPEHVVKGENIEFSGLKSNLPGYTIMDYSWDFGDSARMHGETVSHTFEEAGKYEVTLFLTIRSVITGIARNTSVTREIKVWNNLLEKEYHTAQAAATKEQFMRVIDSHNARLTTLFSADAEVGKEAVFCIELISSLQKMELGNPVFRRLPDKYNLKERFDELEKVYSYTVERQMDLMKLYPAYVEIRNLGFDKAQAKLFPLRDPAEKELFSLLNSYVTSMDAYFDRYDRLTTDAYIMLDQIMKFLTKYPDIKLEIGVHTDNIGSASANNALSQRRARMLADYLINRGIERSRLTARGFGGSKPVGPNTYELDRRENRRVEYIIY